MREFIKLYHTLDQTNSTRAKVAAMVNYFNAADPADTAWATFFLSGRRLKRLVSAANLRRWLVEASELPEWLVEDTYASVGDLAETIALLLADRNRPDALSDLSLAEFVTKSLKPIAALDDAAQRDLVLAWWRELPYNACYIVNKLMTGALRVGVSQALVASALAEVAGLPRPVILHRMMGHWSPGREFAEQLLAEDDGAADLSRPYPYCLASPIESEPGVMTPELMERELGVVDDWQVEWKWDGIRAQLIRRGGNSYLWSRGEELIDAQFPELIEASAALPEGTVIDGEILAWRDDAPMPFSALQRRIGRKKPGKKTLSDYPVILRAYDLLELDGSDVREWPLSKRRAELESLAEHFPQRLRLSEVVVADDWSEFARLRESSRERRVEGFMVKRRDAGYGTGRTRGIWWKWKIEPHTIDAVMLYAQAGHGRRANLHTDYTFAVWRGEDLVPVAKAYSGLTNAEIDELDKWIRKHTRERFGPVRSVEPEQVFELAFEAIASSTRHKSGVALRFPRIRRWRRDLAPAEADTIETLQGLL
ncbi:MAG: ATP-dependent DNA ligase [Pseudomonadota bacterium]